MDRCADLAEQGLSIQEVLPDSAAAKAGLKPSDIIIQLGRYRIATLEDFGTGLHQRPDTGPLRIGIVRMGFTVLELKGWN